MPDSKINSRSLIGRFSDHLPEITYDVTLKELEQGIQTIFDATPEDKKILNYNQLLRELQLNLAPAKEEFDRFDIGFLNTNYVKNITLTLLIKRNPHKRSRKYTFSAFHTYSESHELIENIAHWYEQLDLELRKIFPDLIEVTNRVEN